MTLPKITYLTGNPHKVEEANRFLRDKFGFELDIKNPDFEVPEIQAKTCAEVAAFSAHYGANKLGVPCLKSDTGLYIECLGGLPGPYNAYFDKQIGAESFLQLLEGQNNRGARLEHVFAYCEPGKDPVVFTGGGKGRIGHEIRGKRGRWHDKFYIPEGEELTLSELRAIDPDREATFWGTALDDFAEWYKNLDHPEPEVD